MSSIGKSITKVVGGITGATEAGRGAERAGRIQAAAAERGIEEQARQFDNLVKLMTPFIEAGSGAIGAQQSLLGLGDPVDQEEAINAIANSPQFQTLVQQGEEAILQNAAATGNLRGGNVQAALAEFRPQILSQLIESQFNKLGSLSQLGQASAAGQGAAGIQSASNIGNLLAQQGAARAGGVLAKSNVQRQSFQDALDIGKAITSAMAGGGF